MQKPELAADIIRKTAVASNLCAVVRQGRVIVELCMHANVGYGNQFR